MTLSTKQESRGEDAATKQPGATQPKQIIGRFVPGSNGSAESREPKADCLISWWKTIPAAGRFYATGILE